MVALVLWLVGIDRQEGAQSFLGVEAVETGALVRAGGHAAQRTHNLCARDVLMCRRGAMQVLRLWFISKLLPAGVEVRQVRGYDEEVEAQEGADHGQPHHGEALAGGEARA